MTGAGIVGFLLITWVLWWMVVIVYRIAEAIRNAILDRVHAKEDAARREAWRRNARPPQLPEWARPPTPQSRHN